MSEEREVYPLWLHAEVRLVVPVAEYYDGPSVGEHEVRLPLRELIEHIADSLEVTAFGREDSASIRAASTGYAFSLPNRIQVASGSHPGRKRDE